MLLYKNSFYNLLLLIKDEDRKRKSMKFLSKNYLKKNKQKHTIIKLGETNKHYKTNKNNVTDDKDEDDDDDWD